MLGYAGIADIDIQISRRDLTLTGHSRRWHLEHPYARRAAPSRAKWNAQELVHDRIDLGDHRKIQLRDRCNIVSRQGHGQPAPGDDHFRVVISTLRQGRNCVDHFNDAGKRGRNDRATQDTVPHLPRGLGDGFGDLGFGRWAACRHAITLSKSVPVEAA